MSVVPPFLEFISRVMVEVLLCVAGVFPEVALGELPDLPIRELFRRVVAQMHCLSYPRVHGKGLDKIEGKQENAIGDLLPDAGKNHQLSLGIMVFQVPQRVQIHGFGPSASLQEITGPESSFYLPQTLAPADLIRAGKTIAPVVTQRNRLPILTAKLLHYGFDMGNILDR